MVNENDVFCSSGMQSANMLGDGMSDGMIMYMDGFRFSLLTSEKNSCLNLYFPSWTLNTRSKFLWAMLGIVLLGIVTEGVSKLRHTMSRRLTGMTKRWIMSLLHGVQALVGYILMLATMTFSVELLACVILGLGTGFAIFYDDDDDNHVTTNPCCNFIQEEFKERVWNIQHEQYEGNKAPDSDDLSVPLLHISDEIDTHSQGII